MESGPPASRRLTAQELAAEAGVELEYVRRLAAAEMLRPDGDGLYVLEDVMQIQLAHAMAEGGIGLDDLAWVAREHTLPLDRVREMWTLSESSGRTFGEFAGSLGEREDLVPALYAAFGLGAPPPETVTRRDEEEAVAAFLELWSLVDDDPDLLLRAARIAGEGIRRIETAMADLFGEFGGAPPARMRRGLPLEEAVRPSQLFAPAVEKTLLWLHSRHMAHEVFERIVDSIEGTVARAGRIEQGAVEPPAIAFVDLAGYTRLAATAGDERAAQAATSLHALALEAAHPHGGRVVKLLGDGVLLRYPATRSAVTSVAGLMTEIPAAGLPAAHAGIAAGPIITRDGDVYGHTVNLASRIAGHASAGELLVAADCVDGARAAGFECEDAGEAALRGLTEPVQLARIRVAQAPG